MNRHHSKYKERKLKESPARPSPGVGSSPEKKFDSEAANPWPKGAKPGKFDFNSKTNFPRVKDVVNRS